MTRTATLVRILVGLAAAVLGCGDPPRPAEVASGGEPRRIVSVDYCADQFVLKFAERARILAVSPDAERPFSYMRAAAEGLPKVHPTAEDVLVYGPDLVVRAYGGGPHFPALMERAGVPVQQVPFVRDLQGVRHAIRTLAKALGASDKGDAIVRAMDRRLAALARPRRRRSALYITPAGVTAGPGTLVHEMIGKAGLTNFQKTPGWHPIPLERLAYEHPDVVVTAFPETAANNLDAWSAMQHPVARQQTADLPTIQLDPAWTTCGGWFLVDAIETLAAFDGVRPSISPQRF